MNLIDMDRLRKELMAKGDIPIHKVFNTIWEQPIVNISQPKIGRWMHPYKSDIACECSECHIQIPITKDFKYCPNCGAYMRESDKE